MTTVPFQGAGAQTFTVMRNISVSPNNLRADFVPLGGNEFYVFAADSNARERSDGNRKVCLVEGVSFMVRAANPGQRQGALCGD